VLKWVSWNDFHGEASGLLVSLIGSLKSTVGLVSKLDQFYFSRCGSSSQKFSIIGFAVKELHLLKVEEVELFFSFLNLSKWFLVSA
jgi:hypothetical protein